MRVPASEQQSQFTSGSSLGLFVLRHQTGSIGTVANCTAFKNNTGKRGPRATRPPELNVPKRTEHPVMGVRSQRNHITTNIAEAIVAVAKKPTRACVDVRKGDKFLIENSGLVKKYLKKKVRFAERY